MCDQEKTVCSAGALRTNSAFAPLQLSLRDSHEHDMKVEGTAPASKKISRVATNENNETPQTVPLKCKSNSVDRLYKAKWTALPATLLHCHTHCHLPVAFW